MLLYSTGRCRSDNPLCLSQHGQMRLPDSLRPPDCSSFDFGGPAGSPLFPAQDTEAVMPQVTARGAGMCRMALVIFAMLYLAALALFVIGTFGLFGSPQGPLAGIFLVPLGLPWILMIEAVPEAALPWLGALAPLLNLALIAALCRWLRRPRTGG
jgi:hypothetical protein